MKKKILKNGFIFLVALIVVIVGVSYSLENREQKKAYAHSGISGSVDLIGHAWSSDIGWISFSSLNCDTDGNGSSNGASGCPASGTPMASYGVGIKDMGTYGEVSGHAWAGDAGWISFNRADTGVPPVDDAGLSRGVLAYLDSSDKFYGWARALGACDNNGDGDCADAGEGGASLTSGGWDGWIKLTKDTGNPKYITKMNLTAPMSYVTGMAWGADVIGWISLNSRNCDADSDGFSDGASGCPASGTTVASYGVKTLFELNKVPSVGSFSLAPNYCSNTLNFSWSFTDPNINSGSSQGRYKIEGSFNSQSGPWTTIADNNSNSESVTMTLGDLQIAMGTWFSEKLYWKVTVWDNGSPALSDSGEASGEAVTLPDRSYPSVSYVSNPIFSKIFADQETQFINSSVCYGAGNTTGACSWSWNIPGATYKNPDTSLTQSPVVIFNSNINTTVSLTAVDEGGNSCVLNQPINVGLPLPDVHESGQ